jgi:ABC-type nitrate/sulfonate/bicarbonate transport system ATPase subunit
MSAQIEFRGADFAYDDVPIFRGLDLSIDRQSYIALVGQSGSGKTTLLRLVAGLESPNAGSVELIDDAVSGKRGAQLVFQDYSQSLLPWLTVRHNVALGLPRGTHRREAKARVDGLLHEVGLPGTGSRMPRELSGGMQQRIALARALASDPQVLLLDEPFGALDTPTKLDLQDLLQQLWKTMGLTVLHVTHDLDEACYLADRVVLVRRAKPAIVFANSLPRPRHRLETRETAAFLALRRTLFEELGYA